MRIKPLLIAALAVVGTACGLDKQTAPSLTGPASFGVSVALTASPDELTQDGSSTSTIQVVVTDANNQPISNLNLRADTSIGGNIADFGTLSSKSLTTNSTGRASVVFTSPAPPPPSATADNVVTLGFTPVGQDFANATARTVNIRLARPNPALSTSDLQPLFTFASSQPSVGDVVAFDASTSKIASGRTIVNYAWNFGGGATANGKQATHAFNVAGANAVTLTITDDLGRTAATAQVITVTAAIPTANFVTSPSSPGTGQPIIFNASPSTAAPGRFIVGWSWDFGDGSTSTQGPSVQHSYSLAATYTVVLTVTDDAGQHATATKSVTAGPGPTAAFTSSVAGRILTVNGSGSTAPAGRTIVSYAWDFGDGDHATGATPSNYTYPGSGPGTFNVTLTVTDSTGAIATLTVQVSVS